jgi:L-aspartate oxidase
LPHTTDYLVIGSGVAGLFFALKAAEHGQVLLITKGQATESNTQWAQGGIAGVFAEQDSFEKHIEDTLIAGDGLCNPATVRRVVEEGPDRIQELMDYGTRFDRAADGTLLLGKEGGHSENRILHSRDSTGAEIARALLEAAHQHPNITLTEHLFAVDLLTQHHLGMYVNRGTPGIQCYGVYALNLETRTVTTILARCTVLASGGAGHVYATTTNPTVATGDGVAMAYRAMGRVANLEFYQFHPTALYEPGVRPAFLITEALRGKGAYLRHSFSRERFMHKYDDRLELAPRDIVARAIDAELKNSGTDFVYLDATHLPAEELRHEFPAIYDYCLKRGVDITRDLIPVRPAAHYMCGGIHVDEVGQSSIQRLYAIGECSCTGLHGANRLASNSLLEAIVYAKRAAQHSSRYLQDWAHETNIPDWTPPQATEPEEWVLVSHNRREVQTLMQDYVGIVRTNLRLERATRRLDLIYHETEAYYRRSRLSPELCELRNLITCAYLIVKGASLRKESRGLHYTLDFPEHAPRAFDLLM